MPLFVYHCGIFMIIILLTCDYQKVVRINADGTPYSSIFFCKTFVTSRTKTWRTSYLPLTFFIYSLLYRISFVLRISISKRILRMLAEANTYLLSNFRITDLETAKSFLRHNSSSYEVSSVLKLANHLFLVKISIAFGSNVFVNLL
jgi:hypothetical protein